MPNQHLSYPEKLQLLSDLRDFYMKDFGMIYDNTPEGLGRLKGASIGLILDSVNTFFKGDYIPSKEELMFVLKLVLNENFLNNIYKDRDGEEIVFMKTGFGCAAGILLGDKHIINIEKEELEKVGGLGINCSLM